MRPTIPSILAVLLALPASAQDAPRVYDVHEVDYPPAVLNVEEFSDALSRLYPPALRDSAIGGTATVEFVIGSDGAVRDPAVVDAARPALGAATMEAVRVLRFAPATIDGEAVEVRVTQPVSWQVDTAAAASGPGGGNTLALPDTLDPAELSEEELWGAALELSAVSEPPRLLNERGFATLLAREYPTLLRDAGVGGEVLLAFVVDARGRARSVRVVSSTADEFVRPSIRTIRRLRFTPARLDGAPVPVRVFLPIRWSISGPGGIPSFH